jgi:hypothetical protein
MDKQDEHIYIYIYIYMFVYIIKLIKKVNTKPVLSEK